VQFKTTDLPYILNLIYQLGLVISEVGISGAQTTVDPIEMVVLLINLSQNILSEVKQELDAASQKELESYIKKLVVLFNSLLGDLTHLYTKKSLITEPEPLIDPVQQFLAKESLLTSGQKEKIDRGVDEDEEDEKESIIQKDIIMYQSLSNLLMLISNLSSKVVSTEHSEASKILGSVSEALKSINTLFKSDKYSHETVNMSQRQVLKLQNSAFEKLVIRCLDKDDREILNKSNSFFTHMYRSRNIPGRCTQVLRELPRKTKDDIDVS